MTSSKKSPSKDTKSSLPLSWQILIGLALIGLITLIALSNNTFVSAWHKEDSSIYNNSRDALSLMQINPSDTTLVLFWDTDCETCFENFNRFSEIPGQVRILGVHLSADQSQHLSIQKAWARVAPVQAKLVIDPQDLLKTSFQVRGVPTSFVVKPKEKTVYGHVGPWRRSFQKMIKLIQED